MQPKPFKNTFNTNRTAYSPQFLAVMMALFVSSTVAWAAPSSSFNHKDWEVVCDNVLTCRAAGYATEDTEQLLSVLLTRQAGAISHVTAQVQLGGEWLDNTTANQLPNPLPMSLWLNKRNSGNIQLSLDSLSGNLSDSQTQELLAALKQGHSVEFRYQNKIWTLSMQGSSAVLLKMDDLQGRVGTATALIRKGNASLKQIKAAPMLPVIQTVRVADSKAQTLALNSAAAKSLLSTLREGTANASEDCETLSGINNINNINNISQFAGQSVMVYALNAKTKLVEVPCWRGAYNAGYGYWVVHANLKKVQQLVTLSGSSYATGTIEMAQKGRGIGDCWSTATWVWTGQRFALSAEQTAGMCRGFAGGAWSMPSFVSKVVLR